MRTSSASSALNAAFFLEVYEGVMRLELSSLHSLEHNTSQNWDSETLGLAYIDENVHSNHSIFVTYYTPSDEDRPPGPFEHGIHIEVVTKSKRPRALFELKPWIDNNRVWGLGEWLDEQFPLMMVDYTDEEVGNPSWAKRTFIERSLQFCPWAWVPPDDIRRAWDDVSIFIASKWEELMASGPDDPIEPQDIKLFRRPLYSV
ncbi:hypothetical protein F5Y12DRAFT_718094 [Xylaria sp. FL1777]|nr:hypothetical protein F5Y12DRAFT_718094 [Xylaria sp. FL1777]